jgi:tRNA G46 methylase TrmB
MRKTKKRLPRSPAGTGILNTIGYFMHAGGHGTIPSDWDQYLKFMQLHLKAR